MERPCLAMFTNSLRLLTSTKVASGHWGNSSATALITGIHCCARAAGSRQTSRGTNLSPTGTKMAGTARRSCVPPGSFSWIETQMTPVLATSSAPKVANPAMTRAVVFANRASCPFDLALPRIRAPTVALCGAAPAKIATFPMFSTATAMGASSVLFRLALRVHPDMHGLVVIRYGDQFCVAVGSQGAHRSPDVQLVLPAGEQRLNHGKRHLDVDLFGPISAVAFVADLDQHIGALFRYPHVLVFALNGYKLAVPGATNGVHESVQVDIVHVVLDPYLTVAQAIRLDGRQNLRRKRQRHVDAHLLFVAGLGVHPDVNPLLGPRGLRHRPGQ